MSIQIHGCSGTTITAGPRNFMTGLITGSAFNIGEPIAVGVTFRNWAVRLTVPPGVGTTRTLTLQKNDVNTALTLAFGAADTYKEILGTDVSFAAGDTIKLVAAVTGSPAATNCMSIIEIEPDTPGTYLYGYDTGTDGTKSYLAPFGGAATAFRTSVEFTRDSLIGVDGTLTNLICRERTAPGGVTSRSYRLVKNDVEQDGTGGTVDTRAVISGANTVASSAFSLPVVAGDRIGLRWVATGSPANPQTQCGTLAFQPTDPDQYQFAISHAGMRGDGTVEYARPLEAGSPNDWDTVEANRQFIGHPSTDLAFETIRARLSGAPGAGKSYTFTLRKNGANTALTLTIADLATTGTATSLPVTITAGDLWNVSVVGTNNPDVIASQGLVSIGFGTQQFEEPTIETLSATNIRSTSATLRGRIDPNGTAIDGRFRWWICAESPPMYTETDPQSIGAGDNPIVYTESLTGLLPATTYCYQALGTGFSPELEGAIKSFTTSGEAEFIDGTVSHPLTWLEMYVDDGDLI